MLIIPLFEVFCAPDVVGSVGDCGFVDDGFLEAVVVERAIALNPTIACFYVRSGVC